MISFDAAHAAVHYPSDRRFRIWIRPSILVALGVLVALPVLAAWIEFLFVGLPHIPPVPQILPGQFWRSAWLPGVGALLSLFQLPFCYDADPKRLVDSCRPSSSLFQQSLHTG